MLPKKSIEDVIHVTPCVSDRMADAIQLWSDMYEGCSPWLREPTFNDPTRIVSLGLPALIASEKARMATLEMKSEITAIMETVDKSTMQMEQSDEIGSNLNTAEESSVNAGTTETVESSAGNSPAVQTPSISPSAAFEQNTMEVPTGSTERADFLNKQYKKCLKQIRRQLEYGIAKGGLVIKPYIVLYDDKTKATTKMSMESSVAMLDKENKQKNKELNKEDKNAKSSVQENPGDKSALSKKLDNAEIEFDFIQADRFFPLSFDANGKVIEGVFVQTKVDKARERVYLRLEHHKLERHTVTVSNFAFESTDMSLANSNNIRTVSNLGTPIPLTDIPEWANLEPVTIIEDCDRLLFAYFRMPEANTIDPYSPLGVSGYSRVVQLIKDADMQYSRMLWEFEGGELAIDVDRNALDWIDDPVTGDKVTVLPMAQRRLFRKVDLNQEDTYNVFAPSFRDVSLVHGLDTIFMRIEDACGLSRGTLSNVTTQEARTATELKILKQRSFATNADIQMALQDALEDTVYVMDVYCTLYDVTEPGEYSISFEWDDSIIIDSESELSKRITLMQNGLASKLETRMWYFGETENQAKIALQQIDKESTEAMIQSIQAEQMKLAAGGNNEESTNEEEGTDEEETTSPSDTTSDKKSQGKQADSLNTPNKSKSAKSLKNDK